MFNFSMDDNPMIHEDERKALAEEYARGSTDLYEQEIMAKFITSTGQLFNAAQFKIVQLIPEDRKFDTFLAVDLAGFETDPYHKTEKRRLDDSAIAIVKVDSVGRWFVVEVQSGKWDVRETALKIVTLAHKHKVPIIGI